MVVECSGGGVDLGVIGKKLSDILYDDIISVENLLEAWKEFLKGKKKRKDVQEFQINLMDNILDLRQALARKTYQHGAYEAFTISDPKPRHIHKASVRDRLLHHAIYRILYPAYDQTFITHSYSCRLHKGTHRALKAFTTMKRQVSNNHTKTAWVLKCDIRKFFASIDQEILQAILLRKISNRDVLWLLSRVISSFETDRSKGLPLGNLTSQLLVNIYMNEFDQYVKRDLKAKYYIRYADDFVVLAQDRKYVEMLLLHMRQFLEEKLALTLHPHKVSIKTIASGIDFLGWQHFPTHRTLRTVTKRRMLKKLKEAEVTEATRQSYGGLLKHGNTYKIQNMISRLPC